MVDDGRRPPGYPEQLVERAFLDDGTSLVFRPILPDDTDRLERLFHRLSPQSVYRRFLTSVPRPQPRLMAHLANVDYHDRLALVATVTAAGDEEIVGVARYDRLPDSRDAEAAVIVEDGWQHRGIGTRLLWRLTAAARARGIEAFVGLVLAENRPMMGLLTVLAARVEQRLVGPEYEIRVVLDDFRDPDNPTDA